jgi:hypothetical protein
MKFLLLLVFCACFAVSSDAADASTDETPDRTVAECQSKICFASFFFFFFFFFFFIFFFFFFYPIVISEVKLAGLFARPGGPAEGVGGADVH